MKKLTKEDKIYCRSIVANFKRNVEMDLNLGGESLVMDDALEYMEAKAKLCIEADSDESAIILEDMLSDAENRLKWLKDIICQIKEYLDK